jgi:hypothetical protein
MPRDKKLTPEMLYAELRQSNTRVIHSDGSEKELPQSVEDFLQNLLTSLRDERSLILMGHDALLTIDDAAGLLGVTPEFLKTKLDQNKIPFQLFEKQQRIRLRDVLAYRAQRDTTRRQILDELTRAEAADGLYDLDAVNDRSG